MNHACTCGHSPGDHDGGTGACQYAEHGRDGYVSWYTPCLCDRYEWAGDE